MLFGVLALALIIAEMYLTRDTEFYFFPEEPSYDYR